MGLKGVQCSFVQQHPSLKLHSTLGRSAAAAAGSCRVQSPHRAPTGGGPDARCTFQKEVIVSQHTQAQNTQHAPAAYSRPAASCHLMS